MSVLLRFVCKMMLFIPIVIFIFILKHKIIIVITLKWIHFIDPFIKGVNYIMPTLYHSVLPSLAYSLL